VFSLSGATARWNFFKQKVNDCVQHIIPQKFTNFHAIRSWNFQNICNEIGWPRYFAPPCKYRLFVQTLFRQFVVLLCMSPWMSHLCCMTTYVKSYKFTIKISSWRQWNWQVGRWHLQIFCDIGGSTNLSGSESTTCIPHTSTLGGFDIMPAPISCSVSRRPLTLLWQRIKATCRLWIQPSTCLPRHSTKHV